MSALLRASSPLDVPTLVVFTAKRVCLGRLGERWELNTQFPRLATVAAEVPAFHYVVDLPRGNLRRGASYATDQLADVLRADHITLAYPNDDRMKRIVRDTAAYYRVLIEGSEVQRAPQECAVEVTVSRNGVAIRDAGRLRAILTEVARTPAGR